MTRDGLLEKIDEVKANLCKGVHLLYDEIGIVNALCAVVELIDEHESDYYLGGLVERIREAIEKALGHCGGHTHLSAAQILPSASGKPAQGME